MNSKELDQFYTKQSVAIECIKELHIYIPMQEYDTILEPSAGSGAFFYNLDKKKRIGIDIAPTTRDIAQMDFFNYTPPKGKTIVVGNPPFGVQSKLAVNFFNRAALFTDTIAFIVPITWQKWSIQRRLCEKFKLIYSKPLSPDSFIFNGEEYKVKCAFQIWTCRDDIKCVDQRIRVKPKTTHPDFDFLPKSKRNEADFLFVVCGNRSQLIHSITSHIAIQTTERIKAKHPYVKKIFENIDWSAHTDNNVGTMWINRETIVKEYEKYEQQGAKNMIKTELVKDLKRITTDALINQAGIKCLLHELQCGDIIITTNSGPCPKIIGSGHTESVKDSLASIKGWYKDNALNTIAIIDNAVLRLMIEWVLPQVVGKLEEFNHELFKNYPHYWFVRALRNVVSHSMHFSFEGKIKNYLPVSWGEIEINEQLEGKELTQEIITHSQAAKLVEDIFEYVKNTYPD